MIITLQRIAVCDYGQDVWKRRNVSHLKLRMALTHLRTAKRLFFRSAFFPNLIQYIPLELKQRPPSRNCGRNIIPLKVSLLILLLENIQIDLSRDYTLNHSGYGM